MPFISVILPNYNHVKFLSARIESILNQTFTDFELIILDDCSVDESKMIIEDYRNCPQVVDVIYNAQNSGSTFKQWKKGIDSAVGEFIWIAESDDFSHPNFLETLVDAILRYPQTVLAYCRSEIINNEGKRLGLHKWMDALDEARWTASFVNCGNNEIENYLRYRNTIPNASAVVFKNFPGMAEWINTDLKFAGDWDFWTSILRKGNIYYSSEALNFFRKHQHTTRQQKSFDIEYKRIEEYFRVINTDFTLNLKRMPKYDWIIDEWLGRKSSFGKSLKYYFPPLPWYMLIRFYRKILRRFILD